jgi:hypothetical protein
LRSGLLLAVEPGVKEAHPIVRTLTDGQTFVDSANGVQVTQTSHGTTTAKLSVTAP